MSILSQGQNSEPVTVFDFNKDGKRDILLPMVKYVNLDLFSYILLQKGLSSVNESDGDIIESFNITQNYPNPFNMFSQIKVISKLNSKIKVNIYNIVGKEVRTLLDRELPAGEYTIEWDGKDVDGNILNSGVYFIRMESNGFQKTIKSILMK
ncbi:MAG: T9SS type A sorting domain-containing protein [Ignavibacteriaceae bacterium]|nr:T9SS type A sorting domain-containing protein [Ignavibacteriaceae bacterium]